MRVFDGFLVNDELDLLELRLMELDPVVDVFVGIQMDRNFRNEPKKCHVDLKDPRWVPWREKFRLLTIKGRAFGPHPETEWTQRRLLAAGFGDAADDDLLMLSDVDEIPSRRVVDAVKNDPFDHPMTLLNRLFYYSVNLRMCRPWAGTVIWPKGCIKGETDLQELRNARHRFPQIADAGWHFSWMGDAEAVQRKLGNLDVPADAAIFGGGVDKIPSPDDLEAVRALVDSGVDLFSREDVASTLLPVDIEPGSGQPHEILAWLARHPQYQRVMA